MRFEPGSPVHELVKTLPHVAFEVEDIDEALQGKTVLSAPGSPSNGVRSAMIIDNGCPVELIEFREPPPRIGISGDNCTVCPRYLATLSGDPRELEKVRDLWVRVGFREPDFPAEKLACRGCIPGNQCAYTGIRDCAHEKAVADCGLCDGYPCALIDAAFTRSDELRPRLAQACSPAELAVLEEAFLSKKRNLDRVHQERPRQ